MKRVAQIFGMVPMMAIAAACGSVEQSAEDRILEVHLDVDPGGRSIYCPLGSDRLRRECCLRARQ